MNYTENIQSLWTEVKNNLELQKQYLLMGTAEKLTVLLSAVATAVLCLAFGAMALLFLLLALGFWLGHIAGNSFIGFLFIGVFLLLTMVVVLFCRKRWIVQPLARLVVGLFVPEEEEEQVEGEEAPL